MSCFYGHLCPSMTARKTQHTNIIAARLLPCTRHRRIFLRHWRHVWHFTAHIMPPFLLAMISLTPQYMQGARGLPHHRRTCLHQLHMLHQKPPDKPLLCLSGDLNTSFGHGVFFFSKAFTYVDGRLLLVSSEDPDLYVGPHQSGDGLWHARLESVLYGCGTQQHQVLLAEQRSETVRDT